MIRSELLVPSYPAGRSAYCRRPSPTFCSIFRVQIFPRLSAPRAPPARACQSRLLSARVPMVTPELLVPRYPASRSAYCGRPSPPVRSGFRVDIMPYPLDPVLPYLASTTAPQKASATQRRGGVKRDGIMCVSPCVCQSVTMCALRQPTGDYNLYGASLLVIMITIRQE